MDYFCKSRLAKQLGMSESKLDRLADYLGIEPERWGTTLYYNEDHMEKLQRLQTHLETCLNKKEVAKKLNVSPLTLKDMEKAGWYTPAMLGLRALYDQELIAKIKRLLPNWRQVQWEKELVLRKSKYDREDHYNQRQAARELRVPLITLVVALEQKKLPKPSHWLDGGYYYSSDELEMLREYFRQPPRHRTPIGERFP